MVVSAIGNITVLTLLIKRRLKSHTRLDMMLTHLAIADLLVRKYKLYIRCWSKKKYFDNFWISHSNQQSKNGCNKIAKRFRSCSYGSIEICFENLVLTENRQKYLNIVQ